MQPIHPHSDIIRRRLSIALTADLIATPAADLSLRRRAHREGGQRPDA